MWLIDADYVLHKMDTTNLQPRTETERYAFGFAKEILRNAPTIREEASIKAAAIMQYYGAKHQLLKLAEECAELIQQCMKCFDYNIAYHEDFVEELADVKIMLTQFESILTPAFAELYEKIIREKLDRQIERIESEEEGKC